MYDKKESYTLLGGKGEQMQTNLMEKKLTYFSPFIEIVTLNIDVLTASDDPYVDDGYVDFQ
jgi:hypothetical protein